MRLYQGERESEELVGEADFDLAKYSNSTTMIERLPMRGAPTEDAYIEIAVITKNAGVPHTPLPERSSTVVEKSLDYSYVIILVLHNFMVEY